MKDKKNKKSYPRNSRLENCIREERKKKKRGKIYTHHDCQVSFVRGTALMKGSLGKVNLISSVLTGRGQAGGAAEWGKERGRQACGAGRGRGRVMKRKEGTRRRQGGGVSRGRGVEM